MIRACWDPLLCVGNKMWRLWTIRQFVSIPLPLCLIEAASSNNCRHKLFQETTLYLTWVLSQVFPLTLPIVSELKRALWGVVVTLMTTYCNGMTHTYHQKKKQWRLTTRVWKGCLLTADCIKLIAALPTSFDLFSWAIYKVLWVALDAEKLTPLHFT